MTPHEWVEKWCTEVDPAIRRAHMAIKEAGYDYVTIDVTMTQHGHEHFLIAWPMDYPDIPREVELRAYQISMPPEMYAEAIENGIVGGEPFAQVPLRTEAT